MTHTYNFGNAIPNFAAICSSGMVVEDTLKPSPIRFFTYILLYINANITSLQKKVSKPIIIITTPIPICPLIKAGIPAKKSVVQENHTGASFIAPVFGCWKVIFDDAIVFSFLGVKG